MEMCSLLKYADLISDLHLLKKKPCVVVHTLVLALGKAESGGLPEFTDP